LDQAEIMLPQAWTALALFAQGEISETARCSDPSISPEVFTELLTEDIAATHSQDEHGDLQWNIGDANDLGQYVN
jgi:hypothetical protein